MKSPAYTRTDDLRTRLERLFETYHRPEYLSSDPLVCVHEYSREKDLEIAGLLASSLAYGRVETIIRSTREVLGRCGKDLCGFVVDSSFAAKKRCLDGVRHRFNDSYDIALLLETVAIAVREHGSLGRLFGAGMRTSHEDIRVALEHFTMSLRAYALKVVAQPPRSFEYLLVSPARGSACKRMNMYLRWMIRTRDGVDLGVWKDVAPAKLIIPVDTHIAKISTSMGLTGRKTPDWLMAQEITAKLREVDPADPVRFDFSLCRSGILGLRQDA